MWLAGEGIKPGLVYGATDELGFAAVENVCTVHDLHATMLHQLGIDHDAFSVKFQGLDAKLTGVEGAKVIKGILFELRPRPCSRRERPSSGHRWAFAPGHRRRRPVSRGCRRVEGALEVGAILKFVHLLHINPGAIREHLD